MFHNPGTHHRLAPVLPDHKSHGGLVGVIVFKSEGRQSLEMKAKTSLVQKAKKKGPARRTGRGLARNPFAA
jgi:hypothetical protein